MSWGRQDDGYHDHPKILALSLEAIGLEWLAVSYANKHHTDGEITHAIARHLSRGDRAELYAALVSVGRWEPTDIGYQIHNFLEYNESAKDAERRKNKARSRMRRYRAGSGVVRANTDARSGNTTISVPMGRDGTGSPKSSRSCSGSTARAWRSVPDGETLTPGRITYAETRGLEDVPGHWADFTEHQFVRPRVNVDRTWQRWCREAARRTPRPTQRWGNPKTAGNAAAITDFAARRNA